MAANDVGGLVRAVVREVSPEVDRCEVRGERFHVDFDRATAQHGQYVEVLREALGKINGAEGDFVQILPASPLPDSVFVEDCALCIPVVEALRSDGHRTRGWMHVATRPGADSRKPEVGDVTEALAPFFPNPMLTKSIEAPGTLDGGDVLIADDLSIPEEVGRKVVLVGESDRSNDHAIRQLRGFLRAYEVAVVGIPVKDCLHLKSAVTQAARGVLLVNPDLVSLDLLRKAVGDSVRFIEVDKTEPLAANIVQLPENYAIFPSSFPKTLANIREALPDLNVMTVDADELAKADGAVTCCSVVFREP